MSGARARCNSWQIESAGNWNDVTIDVMFSLYTIMSTKQPI